MALFIDAINALPFFLLASEFDLDLLNTSNIPVFFGLRISSPDFRRSAEFERDAEPLRLPPLSFFSRCFASLFASLVFEDLSLDFCLDESLAVCFESDLEPQVPDLGRGIESASSLVVGRGWEPSS